MSRAAYAALAAGGWTPWPGGAPPLPLAAPVTVLHNDGSTARGAAGGWSWHRDRDPSGFEEPDEIVAYQTA